MRVPYLNLTGEKLLRSLKCKEGLRVVQNCLWLAFFTLFFGSLAVELFSNISEYWFFLFTTPAWILAIYFPAKAIKKHFKLLCAGDQNAVFLKYGTPDEIADILSNPENVQALRCPNLILTKAYFMKKGDFLTYIPLDEIRAISVRRTYGRYPKVQVCIIPKQGESCTYSADNLTLFASVDKQKEMLRGEIDAHMALYAPQCPVDNVGRVFDH